jgi:hypothetical protein
MTQVQAHRGPDDSGLWDRNFPTAVLYRIGQPPSGDSRSVACSATCRCATKTAPSGSPTTAKSTTSPSFAVNSRAKGHRFASHTDTEVIIHLYEQEGPDCVKRLNGMFAFAICDLRSERRPRCLWRAITSASSLSIIFIAANALRLPPKSRRCCRFREIETELDPESLHQYLTFLWVPDPKTMFRRIQASGGALRNVAQGRTEAHSVLGSDVSCHRIKRMHVPKRPCAEEVRERFRRSVEAQMVSDVPIGAFLSAGLDSSSIVAMMAGRRRQPVRTYTVTFPQKIPRRRNHARRSGSGRHAWRASGLRKPAHRRRARRDRSASAPGLAHGRTHCRPRDHHRISGLPRSAQAGYRSAFRRGRRRTVCRLSQARRALLGAGLWSYAFAAATPGRGRTGALCPAFAAPAMKGRLRLAKKMARSASLDPVDRFIANCTYLDELDRSRSLYTPTSQRRSFSL